MNNNFLAKKFNTIFLMYPGSEKYVRKYTFGWYAKYVKWSPILIGFFKQDNHYGLVFGITATEQDFYDVKNLQNLIALNERVGVISNLTAAEYKRFAGVLPSVFVSKKIISSASEGDATVAAVVAAVNKLITDLKLKKNTPIVLLGSMGFIGKGVLVGLNEYPGEIFQIDCKDGSQTGKWPENLTGENLIVLNVTKKGALNDYIPLFWDKVVVLNEVYPEPTSAELRKIKSYGARCFHIVGVEGKAWPQFPGGYSGAIPCCASSFFGKPNNLNVVLREL